MLKDEPSIPLGKKNGYTVCRRTHVASGDMLFAENPYCILSIFEGQKNTNFLFLAQHECYTWCTANLLGKYMFATNTENKNNAKNNAKVKQVKQVKQAEQIDKSILHLIALYLDHITRETITKLTFSSLYTSLQTVIGAMRVLWPIRPFLGETNMTDISVYGVYPLLGQIEQLDDIKDEKNQTTSQPLQPNICILPYPNGLIKVLAISDIKKADILVLESSNFINRLETSTKTILADWNIYKQAKKVSDDSGNPTIIQTHEKSIYQQMTLLPVSGHYLISDAFDTNDKNRILWAEAVHFFNKKNAKWRKEKFGLGAMRM